MSGETRDVEALAELLDEHDRHHAISNAPYGHVCGNECRARTISRRLAEHDAEVEARVREEIAQAIETQGALWGETYGKTWPPHDVMTEGFASIARGGAR